MPPRSIYFHRRPAVDSPENEICLTVVANGIDSRQENCNSMRNSERIAPLLAMKRDFLAAYSNLDVVRWSAWWALATCGYLQASIFERFLQ